jgi:D-alanyl-D-alanine carboxypeptidase
MKKLKKSITTLLILATLTWVLYMPILEQYSRYRNAQALEIIKNINPESHTILNTFIKDIESKTDWKVIIISGYRDEAKQAILKKQNPKNAEPGKSKHNFGKAIDINVFRRNGFFSQRLSKSSSKKAWEKTQIVALAKAYKLNWGGDFRHYHDPVHFEVL